jgi:predicted  nucleic acid-binding Zn-ribbon protein
MKDGATMQLKKRDKPLHTIDEIFEMNGITTPIKENNMELKEKYEHLSKSWDALHEDYLKANRELTKVMEENIRLKETIKKLDDRCRKHLNDSLDYQAKYEFEHKKVKKLAAAYVRVKTNEK